MKPRQVQKGQTSDYTDLQYPPNSWQYLNGWLMNPPVSSTKILARAEPAVKPILKQIFELVPFPNDRLGGAGLRAVEM